LILAFLCLTAIAYNQQRNIEYYLEQAVHNSPLLNDYRNIAELKKTITAQYLAAFSDFTHFSFNKNFLDLFHKEN